MALVVFLRGVNVGGHRSFRPSILAKQLSAFDVINVGAAGTLIVHKPGSRTTFLAELRRRLPFETEVSVCEGRDLIGLELENPFNVGDLGQDAIGPDMVRFVTVLSRVPRLQPRFPMAIPAVGEWYVRLLGSKGRIIFGVYRRHMKTIGCLGRIDRLLGVPATTRNWNTIIAIMKILKGDEPKATCR